MHFKKVRETNNHFLKTKPTYKIFSENDGMKPLGKFALFFEPENMRNIECICIIHQKPVPKTS